MISSSSLVTYFPRFFTQKSINAFLAVSILIFGLFIERAIPFKWFLFDMVEVLVFFKLSSSLSIKWEGISTALFSKKLFYTALTIRLIWVTFSYCFYLLMTGQPFEFEAADSIGYYGEAKWLTALFEDNKFEVYTAYIGKNYSDMGYPSYLALFQYFFGESIIFPRILKAVLGSFTCLHIYKISQNNFGESTGRIAGIMTMLVPNLIYYCGIHVKEIEMVFLTVAFIYMADKIIRSRKVKLYDILWLFILGGSLFLFRTVLAVSMIGSVAVGAFFTSTQVSTFTRRIGLIFFIIAGGYLILITPLSENINKYIEISDISQKRQMKSYATRGNGESNKLARYGSQSIFLPFMLTAPFPTLVNIPDQQNAMMLGGAIFTRNVYAFFIFIALFTLYRKKKLREHILLLSAIFSYIFVLSSSGFALSERFHLPLIPFLLMLAAYGISQMNNKNKKYFVPYLILISVVVIGWNWFKIAGRS